MENGYCLMLYPEEYRVPYSKIRIWLSDAIANGEVTEDVDWRTVDIKYVIELLNDTGKFTFAGFNSWNN